MSREVWRNNLRLVERSWEPTKQEAEKGTAALVPFVQAWKLPLNPEDLDEIVYAVLRWARSEASYEEIEQAVNEQIADHRRQHEEMLQAMAQATQKDDGAGETSDDL